MPKTEVNVYQKTNGIAPLWEWMDSLPRKLQDKFTKRFELLEERGNELRRPIVAFLRDGIYEIRVERGHVNYRVLYGFVGQNVILLSHGCTKEKEVHPKDIDLAIDNLNRYEENPKAHTYME
jgi:hypothetical protein